ncbi:MAG: carboxymuconolactone decarboxylase family protein [Candidatus Methanoperedens sp.]|jgi:alkylhydroperoxidase/carboxymuconolactone decarboxylase family protein YurZ|nr:carboxymuconolactone decarboxylase family protein [Candidatus Methanoperedens sp.]
MGWFNEKTPDVAKAFAGLKDAVYSEGALDARTKELISMAASVLMRCEGVPKFMPNVQRNTAQLMR